MDSIPARRLTIEDGQRPDTYYSRSNADPAKQLTKLEAKTVVDEVTGCWMWTGAKTLNGYGQMTVRGKRLYVHRIAYVLRVGPIPDGLVIDHMCRTRACVNPEHLQCITAAENLGLGRLRKTHCPSGHEYAGDNLHRSPDGYRICRACWKVKNAARWQRELERRRAA